MKKTTLALAISLAALSLGACTDSTTSSGHVQHATASSVTSQQTQSFASFSEAFIDSLWQVAPTWALYSGYHKYDGILEVADEAQRAKTLAFVNSQREMLQAFNTKNLSTSELIDYRLIENLLNSVEWEQTRFRAWQWDPSGYNVAGGFAQIINEDFAPLDERLRSVVSRLENVPAYYEAARKNIKNPTLEHTELALLQNQGAFSVFNDELIAKVESSGLTDAEKTLFKQRFDAAISAINEHIIWLETLSNNLKVNGARDFRIGEALYEEKFALDIQSGMTAKALYNKASADMVRVHAEMARITKDRKSVV